MNAPYAPQAVSSLPLIAPDAHAEAAPRLRACFRGLARSTSRAACVISLLVLSVTLFSAGFLLSFVTILLTFARFTGVEIAPELLLQFACALVAAIWASGVCWEKMREIAAGRT